MGTTLTGTTPQDTYDSLIKVTNNGPLSSTARYLSDGLGNDSVLALSTARVGIGTTSPDTALDVNGGSKFRGSISGFGGAEILLNAGNNSQVALSTNGTGTTEMYFDQRGTATGIWRFRDTTDTRMSLTSVGLGIGTSSPAFKLDVDGVIRTRTGTDGIDVGNPSGNSYRANLLLRGTTAVGANSVSYIGVNIFNTAGSLDVTSDADIIIRNGATERARFLAGGGLTFNGDTAAANALDDYEEGTFTPTIIGSTTAGTATYGGGQEGKYTKIGNVVYFQLYLGYSGGTGTGDLRIAGLPFTIPSNDLPSFTFGAFLNVALTASNIPLAGGIASTNQITIEQIPTGGGSQTAVPYDASAVIQISGFYRV